MTTHRFVPNDSCAPQKHDLATPDLVCSTAAKLVVQFSAAAHDIIQCKFKPSFFELEEAFYDALIGDIYCFQNFENDLVRRQDVCSTTIRLADGDNYFCRLVAA